MLKEFHHGLSGAQCFPSTPVSFTCTYEQSTDKESGTPEKCILSHFFLCLAARLTGWTQLSIFEPQ